MMKTYGFNNKFEILRIILYDEEFFGIYYNDGPRRLFETVLEKYLLDLDKQNSQDDKFLNRYSWILNFILEII